MSTQDPYGPTDSPRDPQRGAPSEQPSWGPPAPSDRSGSSASSGQPGGHPAHPGGGYPGQVAPGGYGGHDRPAPRNGMGVAALVLGILAFLSGFIVVGGVLGLVAIVLGVIGARRARRGEATNRGMAITGIVLGALGVIGAIVALVLYSAAISRASNCADLASQGAPQDQVEQCIEGQFGIPGGDVDD